ncbi:MAG TPA: DUF488 domain-containing protein [Terriglobia bacterium]|nr:DUF488 domain-containing protein [Terriglobia bacterium]
MAARYFWYNTLREGMNLRSGNGYPANANGLHPLFTVGHSILEFENFAALLKDHGVELLVDVRSTPQSGRQPQFSLPGFERLLRTEKFDYLFLGEELGGRPDDADAYRPDGVVDYQVRRKSYAFQAGLSRIAKELEGRTVAMMCAEEDPLECHRFLMVCPELIQLGVTPLHIRKGSRIETQDAAENRLLASTGFEAVAANTLFPGARTDALESAYRLQAEKFAFRLKPFALDTWKHGE